MEELGSVHSAAPHGIEVLAHQVGSDTVIGDSISVNGVCLTVTENKSGILRFDLSEETLQKSNLGSLSEGDPVNLERAVTIESRLGGHIVQGHIDGTGIIMNATASPESRYISIQIPERLGRYVVSKGFISVEGISLTVVETDNVTFSVAVIPYTWYHTVLRVRNPGDRVNIETDILAKYVESLLPGR